MSKRVRTMVLAIGAVGIATTLSAAPWYSIDGFYIETEGTLVLDAVTDSDGPDSGNALAGQLWIGEEEDLPRAGEIGVSGVTVFLIRSDTVYDLKADAWYHVSEAVWDVSECEAAVLLSMLKYRYFTSMADVPPSLIEPLQLTIQPESLLPGRSVRSLLILPSKTGESGRAEIETILEQITISIAEAAG